MTDKINGQGFRPSDTASARRSEAAKPAGSQEQSRTASADKSPAANDTVSITQSGMLMSRLEELVQRTPVVDQERVAAIKDAIASGTYEVDAQRIADRLLKLERELS